MGVCLAVWNQEAGELYDPLLLEEAALLVVQKCQEIAAAGHSSLDVLERPPSPVEGLLRQVCGTGCTLWRFAVVACHTLLN